MSSAQEIAEKFSDEMFNMDCASVYIISPFFDPESFYRIRTANDEFECNDLENLINATEVVLKKMKEELRKRMVS
jgi:hypothetical protein